MPNEKLTLVDVGGAGGIQAKWLPYSDRIAPVVFEPNPSEAVKLRETLVNAFPDGIVIQSALAHVRGNHKLNIARWWGCSSLLEPDMTVLSNYRIGGAFEVIGTESIESIRYDELFSEKVVPAPDAIKIDVQGFEYEVLLGFGGLLQNCIGIELETHFYPIYKGQKILADIVSFLAGFGFVLRKVEPVPSFDGNVVEADVWFTKDISHWRDFDPEDKAKFSLLSNVWDIIDYKRIDPHKHHNEIDPP